MDYKYCKDFKTLTGCGKCTISLSNLQAIKLLTNRSVHYIIEEIFQTIRESSKYRVIPDKSIVICNGCVSISIQKMRDKYNIIYNKELVGKILEVWFNSNKYEIYESYTNLYLTTMLCNIENVGDVTKTSDAIIEIKTMLDQYVEFT